MASGPGPEGQLYNRVLEELKSVYERDVLHLKETLDRVERESKRKEEELLRERDLLSRERERADRERERVLQVEEEAKGFLLIEREKVTSLEVERARLIEDHRVERERLLTALLEAHQGRSSPPDNTKGSKQDTATSETPGESTVTVDNNEADRSTIPASPNTTDPSRNSNSDSGVRSMILWKRRDILRGRFYLKSDFGWAIYTKLLLEAKAAAVVLLTYSITIVMFLKRHGLVDLLSRWTQLNRCFIAFVISKYFLWSISLFGITASSFTDYHIMTLRITDVALGVSLSLVTGVFMFPSICGRHIQMIEDQEVEVSPSLAEKTSIFVIMLFVGIVTDTIRKTFLFSRAITPSSKSAEDHLEASSSGSSTSVRHRSWIEHFMWSFKTSIPNILINYLLFGLLFFVLFISSNQVHKNPYVEIFIFGYLFPVIKQITDWISNKWAVRECDLLHHTGIRRASIIACLGAAATGACTFSQMYMTAITSNDYYLFCMQVWQFKLLFYFVL